MIVIRNFEYNSNTGRINEKFRDMLCLLSVIMINGTWLEGMVYHKAHVYYGQHTQKLYLWEGRLNTMETSFLYNKQRAASLTVFWYYRFFSKRGITIDRIKNDKQNNK